MKTNISRIVVLCLLCARVAQAQQPAQALPAPVGDAAPGMPLVVAPGTTAAAQQFRAANPGFDYQYRLATRELASSPINIIDFRAPEQSATDEMAEDLKTMSLLISENLDRAFANNGPDYRLGVPMVLHAGGRSAEASYVEGFGAIFKLRVQFPLVAPSEQKSNQPARKTSSEWERARRTVAGVPEEPRAEWSVQAAPAYEAQLVETLKNQLLDTLTNASNFRQLTSHEAIVVTVLGAPNALAVIAQDQATNPASGTAEDSSDERSESQPAPEPKRPRASRVAGAHRKIIRMRDSDQRVTVLTIKIKKGDAEAFAAGKMSLEDFRKTAQVATYYGSAMGTGEVSVLGLFNNN